MNKNDFENLVWLYFDGEISEPELAKLRRALATDAAHRAQYAKLHRLHLATVVAVCGRTVDLRQVPPNLITLVDSEPAAGPDTRKIVAFAASFGALAACAALAFISFNGPGAAESGTPALANAPATAPYQTTAVAASPTPAPAEVVGRYAPTSPGAKALSETAKGSDSLAASGTNSYGPIIRQTPAFGTRSPDASGFDMTQVGNDSATPPAATPAVLNEDYLNFDEDLLGNPQTPSENLPSQPLIIR